MGMRAPPASLYKGAGRRLEGGTGMRTSRNKTKQNKTKQPAARAPTTSNTCHIDAQYNKGSNINERGEKVRT